jgi:hypothetical protein
MKGWVVISGTNSQFLEQLKIPKQHQLMNKIEFGLIFNNEGA